MPEGTGEGLECSPAFTPVSPISSLSFPSQCPCRLLWDASLGHLCHPTLGKVRCTFSMLTPSSLQSDTQRVDFLFYFLQLPLLLRAKNCAYICSPKGP